MFRSLRWRLQVWQAAILGLVVILFGGAFYHQLQRSTWGEIDLELLGAARLLESDLRHLPPMAVDLRRPLPPRPPDPNGPPGPRPRRGGDSNLLQPPRPLSSESGVVRDAEYRPFDGQRAGPWGRRPPAEELGRPWPPDERPMAVAEPLYFAIFSDEGRLLRASGTDVTIAPPANARSLEFRRLDQRREVLLRGPRRTLIVVGRDVQPQLNRLEEALLQLIGIGGGVLLLGLLGGWWLAGKAIRPIARISKTAGRVSADNLTERIDTRTMDAELQSLATILNGMLDRLDHAFRQQAQFTADASHELRTPLAVLLSHCELALSRPRSVDAYQQTLATCQKAGQRMGALVDGLLTLARADAGKLELQPVPIDLRVLAAEAAELFAPLAAEREIQLITSGESATCMADGRLIGQCIANLLHNAIVYHHQSGRVWLESSVVDGWAILRVRDDGPGIPADAQVHLFDRFFRVEEARSRSTGGSGLGLAICQSIVMAHAGKLTVASQIGCGSAFTMQLPQTATAQCNLL